MSSLTKSNQQMEVIGHDNRRAHCPPSIDRQSVHFAKNRDNERG
jgi:hypothetical protein